MTLKVYRWNSDTESYDLHATINDDGTVTGSTPRAEEWKGVFEKLRGGSDSLSEWLPVAKEVVRRRYNTVYWKTETQ